MTGPPVWLVRLTDRTLAESRRPARAVCLRLRIGDRLLERIAVELVPVVSGKRGALDVVRAGRDGGVDHVADLRKLAHDRGHRVSSRCSR